MTSPAQERMLTTDTAMPTFIHLLPALLFLVACAPGNPATGPVIGRPAGTAAAAVSALAVAPRPLPTWLPEPHALPDLPAAIPASEVVIDLAPGRTLKMADVVRRTCLDGTWRCSGLSTSATRFPADAQLDRGFHLAAFDDAAWEEIEVPLDWYRKYPKARDPKAPFVLGWYRRSVDIMPAAGERCLLRFGVIGYEADLWVNGQSVGSHHGDFTPWEIDITDQVKHGTNLLALRVRSDLGPNWGAGPAWHTYGSQWWHDNIKGGLWQSCELTREPALRINELLVTPRFAAGTVRLDWRLLNHGPARRLALRAIIHGARQGGESERPGDAVVATIDVPAGASEGHAEVKVPGIKPWSPDTPHLYRATLVAMADDRVVGFASERFGFREFTIQQGAFRLNGQPIYLAGENLSAKNYGGNGKTPAEEAALIEKDLAGLKRNGYVIFRNAHMPITPAVLDRADELGLMVYNEWAWSFSKDIDPVEFPRRNPVELAEWVRRDHNHPAVVMWSCGNEVKYDDDLVRRELDNQVALVRSLDRQGRPVSTFSGAAFGYGSKPLDTDVLDLHDYRGLSEGPWSQWETNSGRVRRFLDATYGTAWPATKPYVVWECVGFSWGERGDPAFTVGDAEAYVRYAGRTMSWGTPNGIGFAGTIGLAAALDPQRGNRLGRKVYGRRIGEFIRRDAMVAGFAPWFQDPQLEEARQWTQPVFAAIHGANRIAIRHPLAGSRCEQTLVVANGSADELTGAEAQISLLGGDGATVELAVVPLPGIAAMGRAEMPISFTVPAATSAGWWQLRLAVRRGGDELSRLSYDLFVAPRGQAGNPPTATRTIAVLPGGEQTALGRWLDDLGIAARPVGGIGDLGDAEVAIVPPGCPVGTDDGYALRHWVRAGGILLVMEQPFGEVNAIRQTATLAANTFVDLVVPAHPLFAGLSPEAFDTSDHSMNGLWVRAGIVPITANVLAARGPFLSDHGASTVISEGTLGKGRILVSQLLALDQWNRDSVATTYLRNLAGYLLASGVQPVAAIRPWQELGGSIAVENDRCRAIDLSAVANRAFADQTADDGIGGWTDQGGNDFRVMPLGAQCLQGVPFTILDPAANQERSCLVLGGAGRPAFPRQAEGIPVGGPVARLFFLHTAAWVGAHGQVAMTYRVHYADGQTLDIPVRAGIELADWWNPCDLPGARLGLTRTNDQLRDVGLFLMPWENPRPGVAIETLAVVSTGTMVPIVVAITAESAHPQPLHFNPTDAPERWDRIVDRPSTGASREGPGLPVVSAGDGSAPGGGVGVRIAFPAPTETLHPDASRSVAIPVALIGLPAEAQKRLAEGSWRYLTFWVKAESVGSLDVVLPRQDWQDMLKTMLPLDPSQGWRKVRMSLAADLHLGVGKDWEAKDLRGELLLYHGLHLRPGAPLPQPVTIQISDPCLE
jgi:beta-galactosidase